MELPDCETYLVIELLWRTSSGEHIPGPYPADLCMHPYVYRDDIIVADHRKAANLKPLTLFHHIGIAPTLLIFVTNFYEQGGDIVFTIPNMG